jgi:hypothetical protein
MKRLNFQVNGFWTCKRLAKLEGSVFGIDLVTGSLRSSEAPSLALLPRVSGLLWMRSRRRMIWWSSEKGSEGMSSSTFPHDFANQVALLPECSLLPDPTEFTPSCTSMPRLPRLISTNPQETPSRPSSTVSRPDKSPLCSLPSLFDDSHPCSFDDPLPSLGSWARPTLPPVLLTCLRTCKKHDYKNRSIRIPTPPTHSDHYSSQARCTHPALLLLSFHPRIGSIQ